MHDADFQILWLEEGLKQQENQIPNNFKSSSRFITLRLAK